MKWITVDDMYNTVKGTETKFLSSFNADFWQEYEQNHTYYDRLFRRMFASFRYFDQKPKVSWDEITTAEINDLQAEFTDAVHDLLMVNEKKFTELYRINVVPDEQYSILNNYDVTETKEEENSSTGTDTFGEKVDSDSNVYGAVQDSNTHVEGARTDSTTESVGARTDSDSVTQGAQSNTRENDIAGFNSSNYSDESRVNESLGARNDTANHTQGAQSNSKNLNKGEMTTTDTRTVGTRTDTLTHTHGEQENTFEHGGTANYTLRRVGNIGVKTATEIMREHKELWSLWEFYTYIFKEICAELLLI